MIPICLAFIASLNTLELRAVKKILIFDFDGVLADSLQLMLQFAKQACTEVGFPCDPTRSDLEALDTMEFTAYGSQLGIPRNKIDAFVSRSLELFNTREQPLPIFPGMEKVVVQLAGSAKLALITGNSRIVVSKFLRVYRLEDEFQIVLTTEDPGNRVEKILTLKMLDDNLEGESYLIGDAVSDIRAARKTGVKSVAVGWGHQSMSKLRKEEPDFTVDKPTDLVSLFADNEI